MDERLNSLREKSTKTNRFVMNVGCVFMHPFYSLFINLCIHSTVYLSIYPSINQLICPLQVSGHLSYQCPNNALGDRQLPQKKKKRRKDFEYG